MLLDQLNGSDLEFGQWLDEMAAQGIIFLPDLKGQGVMIAGEDGSWYITLKNAGCAQITGNAETFAKTQEHFCGDFVHGAAKIYAQSMETDVSQLVCNDHRICKLGVRAVMNFFNVFNAVDDITGFCNSMFDKLNEACPEGGVAQVEVEDQDGNIFTSEIESSYSLQDDEGCQVSNTQECYSRDVPS